MNLLFRPLRVLADKFNVLQMGIIASERVFKVLAEAVAGDTLDPCGLVAQVVGIRCAIVVFALSFE